VHIKLTPTQVDQIGRIFAIRVIVDMGPLNLKIILLAFLKYHRKRYVLNLTKCELGSILGDLSHKTSGHPVLSIDLFTNPTVGEETG
jgi:hypothetical protein